jgi:hypothetical protein
VRASAEGSREVPAAMSDLSTAFWMKWAVEALTAIGTIGAVLVALFGGKLRPKLEMGLIGPEGEPARVMLSWVDEGGAVQQRVEDARYYRLRVSNRRPWRKATGVQVVLLGIEEDTPDGEWRPSWAGSVPIVWMHERSVRTIGATPAQADLVTVVKNKWLALHPQIKPLNFPPDYRTAVRLRLSLKAEAEEYETAVMRVLVSWDGMWHDGAQEMRNHLRISQEPREI